MLHELPTEIALQMISYLPIHSLYSVTLVSRDWNTLVTINESTVFRNAAILHRFIIDESQFRTGPIDWKAYCRRELEIEKGWRGKGPSVVRELTATGSVVHRLKVDFELGLVITTTQTGGLFVCDIESNRVLWALAKSHVSRHAHLEYDMGYIVFNRQDNCKEVWRHTINVIDNERPDTSPPDKEMLDASAQAAENFTPTGSLRGHFKPWALLHIPEASRAFRFSYPTLLAAATSSAYIWDIPTLQLVSVVRDIQRERLGFINYVEVNELYVFICGVGSLQIFAREGGTLLYQLFATEVFSETWDVLPQSCGLASSVVQPQTLLPNYHSPSFPQDQFMACHVAASGNDLAALTTRGRLVILPGFQRLFSESTDVHHRDIAIIINLQPESSNEDDFSCYLAVGNQGEKMAVATRGGIYTISSDLDFTRLTAECPPKPGVSVCRLSNFNNENFLSFISCLQITHDALYVTYKQSQTGGPLDRAHRGHVHGVGHPFNMEVIPVGFHEDVFVDAWEDDSSEEEEMGIGFEDEDDQDPVHAIFHNLFMPTATNTVYAVSF